MFIGLLYLLSAAPTEWKFDEVTIEAQAPMQIGLAEPLELALIISAPPKYLIRVGKPTNLQGIEYAGSRTEGPDVVGKLQLSCWRGRFEPKTLGPARLGDVVVYVNTGGAGPAEAHSIELPAVEVIAKHTTSDDLSQLRPLVVPTAPMSWTQIGQLGLGLTLLLAAVVLLIRSVRGRQPLSPGQRAGERLDELDARPTLDRHALDATLTIIRQYLESRYQLHAPTQTTPEFLHDELTQQKLLPTQQAALRQLLEVGDGIRFAAGVPSDPQTRALLTAAREFLAGESAR